MSTLPVVNCYQFLASVGAFISDSYVGRYLTIGLGCIASLLGIVVLWLTAMIPQARPPHCNLYKESCKPSCPPAYLHHQH
ncbi:unnamed protein product [Camellia sinensis]